MLDYLRNIGTKPGYQGNRLLFPLPDHGALARLQVCTRVALAWHSIVEDVLPRVARECYKWLLCQSQDTPTRKPIAEAMSVNISGAALGN